MKNFEIRDSYIDKDPTAMVPEVVDDIEERQQRIADIKARNFIDKYTPEPWESNPTVRPSIDEIRAVFSESVLSKLDTETYMNVWSLGSPHYLSHMSRHGFRDHAGMVYHTGGLDEYSDSVFSLLSDSKQ